MSEIILFFDQQLIFLATIPVVMLLESYLLEIQRNIAPNIPSATKIFGHV